MKERKNEGRKQREKREERERERLAMGMERGIVTTLDPAASCGSVVDGPQQSVVGAHVGRKSDSHHPESQGVPWVLHRITEPQNVWGWKGPVWVI